MLAELFGEGPYRFQMRFERGNLADFYRLSPAASAVLREREHWLRTSPADCLAVLPGSASLIQEAAALLGMPGGEPGSGPEAMMRRLGIAVETDLLLLTLEPRGRPRLLAGCACFPSSWDLKEKIGREIDFIHEAVPGLNSAIGTQISGFLSKMRPGISWNRVNWGLSRSAELNQHPSRGLPRLNHTVQPEDVFLRIEHQSLAALPVSRGILFGIRIEVLPLSRVSAEPRAAQRLANALRTMPPDVAKYKGLETARERIVEFLEGGTTSPRSP